MRWIGASILAIALHTVLAILILPFIVPQEMTDEPLDLAKLSFGVVELDQTRAQARAPDQTPVDASEVPSKPATIAVVPQRRAVAAALEKVATRAKQAAPSAAVKPVAPSAPAVSPVASPVPKVASIDTSARRVGSTSLTDRAQKPAALETSRPQIAKLDTVRLEPLTTGRAVKSTLDSPKTSPIALSNTQTATLAVDSAPAPSITNAAINAQLAAPESVPAPRVEDTGTSLMAELYFAGGAQVQVDDRTLASLQTFLSPEVGSQGKNAVRDDLSALLAGQDCARLQTVFLPETGTVELRGHVPNADMRRPLLAALQERIGTGLPVQDNLLILPAPQCSVLGGGGGTWPASVR